MDNLFFPARGPQQQEDILFDLHSTSTLNIINSEMLFKNSYSADTNLLFPDTVKELFDYPSRESL
jgi:hypothetical protein